MKKKLNALDRREFLTLASRTAGLAILGAPIAGLLRPSLARAAVSSSEPHLLLHIRVVYTWDVLMAMDCKAPDAIRSIGVTDNSFLFVDGRLPDREHGSALLGRTMAPLAKHMSDISIINGIMMVRESSDHLVNRAYMSNGSMDDSVAFAPFLIARSAGRDSDRIGHRVDGGDLRDGGWPNKVPLQNLRKKTVISEHDENLAVVVNASDDQGSQATLIREQNKNRDSLLKMESLNAARENIFNQQRDQGQIALHLAVTGLASGYLQSAICDVGSIDTLDSHSQHQQRHTAGLNSVFGGLAAVVDMMKETPYAGPGADGKKSVFDVTTVIVTSEFSRTSAPENGSGTGHNQFSNSALVMGKNIAGGKVIGRSDVYSSKDSTFNGSKLHANLFDFKTQTGMSKTEMRNLIVDPDARAKIGQCSADHCIDYIYPEAIWRTIGKGFGLSKISGIDQGPILTSILKA